MIISVILFQYRRTINVIFHIISITFREHLGVLLGHSDIDVTDPVSDDFYKGTWMKVASDNTSIYEQVN